MSAARSNWRASARWIRYSITPRCPCRTISASSLRCLTPRSVTEFGELGEARRAREMNVLDLDVGEAALRILEQDVDPARLPVFDLAPKPGVSGELLDATSGDGLGDDLVRVPRIDADEMGALAQIRFDQLPGMPVLPGRAVAFGEPHGGAGGGETQHRAGVGAGRRHRLAAVEPDVGEEALVALEQAAAEKGRGESHPRRFMEYMWVRATGFVSRGEAS